jgi:hypothetical protein
VVLVAESTGRVKDESAEGVFVELLELATD